MRRLDPRLPRPPEAPLSDQDLLLGLETLEQNTRRNPYQTRFLNFLYDLVWTIDEAGGGAVRPWPRGRGRDGKSWDALWEQLEDEYLRRDLTFLEKSRRVLASWFTCAFDVWLAAGGQDPRWKNEHGEPVLLKSAGNRTILILARKSEGQHGSEWFVERRIKTILDQFEQRGFRERWPSFPGWKFKTGQIDFENGSRIAGMPQGSDQARAGGVTFFHCEEVAFWEQARQTIGGSVPTLRGGGHMSCVTTASTGSYAHEIRDGRLTIER